MGEVINTTTTLKVGVILVVHLVASPVVNKSNTAEKQQGIYKITKEMVPRRGRRTFYVLI